MNSDLKRNLRNLDTDKDRGKALHRHREKAAISKPRGEARSRFSPHSSQKEPTLDLRLKASGNAR